MNNHTPPPTPRNPRPWALIAPPIALTIAAVAHVDSSDDGSVPTR